MTCASRTFRPESSARLGGISRTRSPAPSARMAIRPSAPFSTMPAHRAPTGSRGSSDTATATSPAMASLVNGAMVRYLDANDISSFGGGHFSDGVPPILAVAQQRRASASADFVEAVIALYETQGALARGVRLHADGIPRPDANPLDGADNRRAADGRGRIRRRRAPPGCPALRG